MSADMNGQGEWDGLAPVGDFAAWYRKARVPDPLTGPLPVPDETLAWIPQWDDSPPAGRHAGPVQCNCQTAGCPDGPRLPSPGDPRVLLSCGLGVTERVWHLRVLDGAWEDVPRHAREAGVRVHKPAVDGLGRIRLDLEHGVLDIAAVFDQHPAARVSDDGGLRWLEAEMASQLGDLRSLGYRGWVKTRPPSLARTDTAYPVPVPEYAPEVAA